MNLRAPARWNPTCLSWCVGRVPWQRPVAAIGGYDVVPTGKAMMRDGIESRDGGGWAALLIGEVCVSFAAVGVGLS